MTWARLLAEHGVRETAGLLIEVSQQDGYPAPPAVTVRIFRREGELLHALFVGACRADGGPVRADVYVHGAWSCDLYLSAVLAHDNFEED